MENTQHQKIKIKGDRKMLASLNTILQKAKKNNYAVGAFNINNLEFLQAVTNAAEKLKSPVILQTTEGAIKYAGLNYLKTLAETASNITNIPIVLHLDHGKDISLIKKCIKLGWTGVMIDASEHTLEQNIKKTKTVVNFAKKYNIGVEAELGTIGGTEDNAQSKKIIYTDPEAAKEFVEKTGINALAVAIGTSHGAYKFKCKSKLNIKLLKQINHKVKIPLVLHGASSVPEHLIKEANKLGAKLHGAKGVSDAQLKQAIKNGINKVNIDTDLRIAFNVAIRKFLKNNPCDIDPRNSLGTSRKFMQKTVENKIIILGSANKK